MDCGCSLGEPEGGWRQVRWDGVRFFFDAGSGVCLWAQDEATKQRFGYAVQLDDLDLLSTPLTVPAGTPLHLPIDAIDEDPDQPRQDFDPDSLAELAETIRERGVRQPISVRRHPQQPDRWMLNFGARRLRASKLAGKEEIPAFVDDTADSYDQVIENEQRAGLTPLELALFVQRRLAASWPTTCCCWRSVGSSPPSAPTC